MLGVAERALLAHADAVPVAGAGDHEVSRRARQPRTASSVAKQRDEQRQAAEGAVVG